MKFESKTLIILSVIFIILAIFSIYMGFIKSDNEDKKGFVCGTSHIPEIPVFYNNATKNIEIIIGPMYDSEKNIIENVNASLEINGTIFYGLSDSNGLIKICVPIKSIPENEFNTNKTVTFRAEGYDEMKMDFYFYYP